ncbi:molybdenum cofactor synthesis domain-containing protein [Actinoalloteichus hoggarensis]|uniref:Molybdopterin adenylyltransferase n=1 Tax=Actinoalloteichus hoggarensis TaxID=1470176 RepID=A0A221WA15_9PSEU|nr:molybdenum cofactor biosynthesis protein MoaE [Actinoalloteichus hoggarensis]ASO22850.1 Molybdopterin adenylyltransferase [Actinoalloteichus hoggarensis]MBB5924008.1 molybdenum cofactor synthesis domain-containing protein [Actinoalloteichus hoggarensis]
MTGQTRHARVITASNRAAAGVYADTTGPLIVSWLRERSFETPDAAVVPDGAPVGVRLRAAVEAGVQVVVTTGGTGISPTDRTPEVTAELLDYELPGVADAIRAAGLPAVPTAVLSRGLVGVAGRTLVVNLPGSRGGVRDGLGVLAGVLDHAIDQLRGGDHPQPERAADTAEPASMGAEESTAEPHGSSAAGRPDVDRSSVWTADAAGADHAGQPASAPAAERDWSVRVVRAEVVDEDLAAVDHEALVADAGAGAVVGFRGVVRDHDGGRGVRELEYVGHPSAPEKAREVAADVAARHPELRAIAVTHRLGLLAVGDLALVCAVSAAHRAAAFTACADLVDEIKARLPIWKRQVFLDGTQEWVDCP